MGQSRDAFEKYLSIQRFCADAGYRKTFEQDVSRELGLGVDISVRIKPEWELLPKRWIVERSLAWLNNSRRLSKDYEKFARSAQAVCIIATFRTALKQFSLSLLVQLLANLSKIVHKTRYITG